MTVYDRDDAREIARRALAAVPDACLDDAALDVGDWATARPLAGAARGAARPARRRVRPARGRGACAASPASTCAPASAPRPARCSPASRGSTASTTGRCSPISPAWSRAATPSPAGPLALPYPCPGRHALWLALGGAAPAFHDASAFAEVEAAFAELPADLRATLGPRLIGRMLDAARPGEARRLLDTSVRNGDLPTPGLRLAEARILAAEGEAEAALALLAGLAAGRDPVALEALMRAVRLALDAGLPLPEDAVTDLRAAALEQRGTAREPELRALLVETLAERAELPAAVREARAAARDLPGDGGAVRGAGRRRPRRGRPAGDAAGALPRDGARRRGSDRGGAGRRPGAALDRRAAGRARAAVAGAAADRPGAGRRRPPVAAGRGRRRSSRSAAARRRAPPSPG